MDCTAAVYNGSNVLIHERAKRAFTTLYNHSPPGLWIRNKSLRTRAKKYGLRGFNLLLFELCKHAPRCDVVFDPTFRGCLSAGKSYPGEPSKRQQSARIRSPQQDWPVGLSSYDGTYVPYPRAGESVYELMQIEEEKFRRKSQRIEYRGRYRGRAGFLDDEPPQKIERDNAIENQTELVLPFVLGASFEDVCFGLSEGLGEMTEEQENEFYEKSASVVSQKVEEESQKRKRDRKQWEREEWERKKAEKGQKGGGGALGGEEEGGMWGGGFWGDKLGEIIAQEYFKEFELDEDMEEDLNAEAMWGDYDYDWMSSQKKEEKEKEEKPLVKENAAGGGGGKKKRKRNRKRKNKGDATGKDEGEGESEEKNDQEKDEEVPETKKEEVKEEEPKKVEEIDKREEEEKGEKNFGEGDCGGWWRRKERKEKEN